MTVRVDRPYTFFHNAQGGMLNGSVYIGESGKNPESYPIQLYSDADLTIAVSQPVSVIDGRCTVSGQPVNLYVAENDYSMIVKNTAGIIITYVLTAPVTLANGISYTAMNSNIRTVQSKLADICSIRDFGTITDGVDCSAVLQAAMDSDCSAIYFPEGDYYYTTGIVITDKNKVFFGDGRAVSNLRFGGGGIAIDVNNSNGLYFFGMNQIGLQIEQNGIDAGLNIYCDPDIMIQNRWASMVQLDKCFFGGVDQWTGYAGDTVRLTNINRPRITDCEIIGRRDEAAVAGTAERQYTIGSRGVYVTCTNDSQPVITKLVNCHVRAFGTGVYADGAMEGFYLDNTEVINCHKAVKISFVDLDSVDAYDPGLFIHDCHIQGTLSAIEVYGVYEAFCHDLEIYRFSAVNGYDFDAIIIEDGNRHKWHNISVSGAKNVGTPGTVRLGSITNNNRSEFVDIRAYNVDEMWTLDNLNTDRNTFIGNVNEDQLDLFASLGTALRTNQKVNRREGIAYTNSVTGVTILNTITNVGSVAVDTDNVAPGSRFLVTVHFLAIKAGAAGKTAMLITKNPASTSTGQWLNGSTTQYVYSADLHSGNWATTITGVWTVSTVGSLSFTIQGNSASSNSTVAAEIWVEQIE